MRKNLDTKLEKSKSSLEFELIVEDPIAYQILIQRRPYYKKIKREAFKTVLKSVRAVIKGSLKLG